MDLFLIERVEAAKRLKSLGRKTLTALSKINTGALSIEVSFLISSREREFSITIFEANHNNCSFVFYGFENVEQSEAKAAKVVALAKDGDFKKIYEFSKEQ